MMMPITKRHAYLILAHANPYVLEKLILLLDDERNDIYIHVDKKVKDFNFVFFSQLVKKSRLKFIDRIKVYWGHVSLVEAELKLFRAAFEDGDYTYYHLISGSDLPLKSQDEIHDFFKANEGSEFIGFSDDLFDLNRVDKIYIFPKYMRAKANEPLKRIVRKLRLSFISLQGKLGYSKTKKEGTIFKFGSQWVSVSKDFVLALLAQEKNILQFYKYSNCPDEIYKQTFAYNSEFKDHIFDENDELIGSQRFMDWKRGRPYTFREEDFELIVSSGLLFSRKFEDGVDEKIVDAIYKRIV